MEWQKLFGFGNEILPAGLDLIDSRGYILASSIFQIGQWGRIKLLRLNLNGDIVWDREYTYNGWTSAAYSIKYTSKNTIVVAGEVTYSGLSYVLNIDTSGNLIWQKIYAYSGLYESGRFISEVPNNGYAFCSVADSSVLGIRYGVLRLVNYSGEVIFQRFRDYGEYDVNYRCLASVSDGGFILCGNLSSSSEFHAYVLKTDSLGDLDPTFIMNNAEQIREYELYQNYPNPFNSQTIFTYSLKRQSDVTIEIYDLLGRSIATKRFRNMPRGQHYYTFNAGMYDLSSGIFFYKIKVETNSKQFVDHKKMLLIK
jgi:hypothetical protein